MSKKNKKVVTEVDENGEVIVVESEKKENVFNKIGRGMHSACDKVGGWYDNNKTKIRNGLLVTGIAVGGLIAGKELMEARSAANEENLDPDQIPTDDSELIPEDGPVPEEENPEE